MLFLSLHLGTDQFNLGIDIRGSSAHNQMEYWILSCGRNTYVVQENTIDHT